MGVTNKLYAPFLENLFKGVLPDLSAPGTDIRVALMGSGFSFSQGHENWAQVSGEEIGDSDYSAQDLDNKTVTLDGNTLTFNADDISFGEEVTITASYAVIYEVSEGKLIACIDFDGEQSSVDGKFDLEWHNDGILTAEVAE